jgi:hypothetical protein
VWDPKPFVQQRPVFARPMPAPTAMPCDPPLACLQINAAYIPFIAGACAELVQRSSWLAATEDDLQGILANMTQVVEIIGTAVQCNSIPAIGPGGSQQACNIAGYMSQLVIRQSMLAAIADIQSGYDVLNYGLRVMQFIPGAGGIFGEILSALAGLYTAITGGTLADYQTGAADDILWSEVTCAIYNAISADAQVTTANYPTLVANVCAISYTLPDVTTAICDYVNSLGVGGFQGLQPQGALAQYDCSLCGGTGPSLGPTGPQPRQISGKDVLSIGVGLAEAVLPILFPSSFPSTPLLTTGSDSDLVVASFENSTPTGTTLRITSSVPVASTLSANVDWIALPPGQD